MNTKQMMDYLAALRENNTKDWFHGHREEYLAAKETFEALVQELILELGKTEPELLPLEPKSLTFKLMRDTRFSADKSPYLPAMRAHISPKGKLPVPVGYYLMLKPGGQSFLGGGLFADMFRDATAMVRAAIAAQPEEWDRIVAQAASDGFTIRGTALKRVPGEYDKEHPQADYLKMKSWFIEDPVPDELIYDAGAFVDYAAGRFRAMLPFHQFLNGAMAEFRMPERK